MYREIVALPLDIGSKKKSLRQLTGQLNGPIFVIDIHSLRIQSTVLKAIYVRRPTTRGSSRPP